ncbi:MAG: UDP-N-acetylglucosamine 1-carboxyvinyltransferase [Chlamydiae bacterium RIFCSPHIGHO2_12_FULL_44_59]|nr:MAG: UDP-N-acetylglucosamine 1-carboxyvinyltransferase [Chlamydiae bacterium RIFCSPHIGHO2_01_FULL_44_39]OGN58014.1 MAG: UDP-N-acetylglucosamine 1-carboxyvinyltransferase [Chlamydiae bacterium RIFCSPHIGHO2_02_FULL_45_9]OGN60493.1 MAG: UDP-N-acetylglucosamine 1-carboxyvinyltransferase [Chlamydiae bacterium RIFCSPHIGHO2_12_FULL_44_59]OGN65947.1 MAG: UDP-N-acetylglucosamine 1-carboxyvinyltransferase [Chlamydiae bacterium RIFCSPLOWO2_01_FULL_44_52]OGN68762.1 MAG: UDP-N-acetylglucosamine 1-carboxy
MDMLKIKGGKPLQGTIRAAGAKNAMTKLLVASLLSDRKCTFYNVPNIGDVEITVNLCKELGSKVEWDQKDQILQIQTEELKTSYIPQRYSGSNRIPILMIGALLGRTSNDIIVPTAGGDLIGLRPVDFHIQALQQLGAEIEYRVMKKEGAYFAQAHSGLKGTVITLHYPSVGATENTILAAVRAKGTTYIKKAAIEPEIIDLILFLQKLGANIMVDADRTICIEEASSFYDVEHTVLSDRNEVASYAMAAISTKGRVFIEGAEHLHMITFLNKLREIGGRFEVKKQGIEFFYDQPLKGGLHIETGVHPGFMTDWQQPFVVLMTQAQGASIVHETVYENRFGYTRTLKEMGADIELFTSCLGSGPCRFAPESHLHSIVVKGITLLRGKDIHIPDLRAGFAYVMASLLSEDMSTIDNVEFLDRGYEGLTEKLVSLGADIQRESLAKKRNLKTVLDEIPV